MYPSKEVLDKNKKIMDLLGISEFHKAGIFGQGVNYSSFENCSQVCKEKLGLIDKYNICNNEINSHGDKTWDYIQMFAPQAQGHVVPCSINNSMNGLSGDLISVAIPYWEKHDICAVNISKGGTDSKEFEKIFSNPKICYVTSAGNEDEKGLTSYAQNNATISVGAFRFNKHDKEVKDGYSSVDIGDEQDLDFTSIVPYGHNFKNMKPINNYGTSFTSPVVIAQILLLQSLALREIGFLLPENSVLKILQDFVVDIGDDGWDREFGNGYIRLKLMSKEDFYRYVTICEFHVDGTHKDNKFIYKNGNKSKLHLPPFIELGFGRTMIGLRDVGECLNCVVKWDGIKRQINILKDGVELNFEIGRKYCKKSMGGKVEFVGLDVAPYIKNNRTVIGLRSVSELFDCVVDWDGKNRKVIIKY